MATATRSYLHDGFSVDLRMRRFFFDRARVVDQIGKVKAKALNRGGTFVRQAARKLLGAPSKKAKPRPPGSPPRIHTRDERATLRNVLYYWFQREDRVIIGPVTLHQVNTSGITLESVHVPELHEYGGAVMIREISSDRGQTWRRRDLRRTVRPWQQTRVRRAEYPERPFMRPALAKTLPRVPELFGGTSGGELFSPGSI